MNVYHLGLWTWYEHQTKGKVAMGSGSCLNDSWWWLLGCTVGFMRKTDALQIRRIFSSSREKPPHHTLDLHQAQAQPKASLVNETHSQ
jgi:hypothetical protein